MQVKICGITNSEDAGDAVAAGADALGLVFYAGSPRCVTAEQAAAIAKAVPPFVTLVGLFVDADGAGVEDSLARVPLNLLQFHGTESAEYCEQFRRPYIKALRMKDDLDVLAAMAEHPAARGFLLDAYRPGVPGGTGESFDWQRVPQDSGQQIVLAGGLTPDNVATALRISGAPGVDTSSGVEDRPGVKSPEKIRRFLEAVRRA